MNLDSSGLDRLGDVRRRLDRLLGAADSQLATGIMGTCAARTP